MIQNTQPNRPMTAKEAYDSIPDTHTTEPTTQTATAYTAKPLHHSCQIPEALKADILQTIADRADLNRALHNRTPEKQLLSISHALAREYERDEAEGKEQLDAKQKRAERARLANTSTATIKPTQKPSHIVTQSQGYTLLHPIGKPHSRINVKTLSDEVALTATAIATLGNHHGWLEAIDTANRLSTEEGQAQQQATTAERKRRASRAEAQAQNIKRATERQTLKAQRTKAPKYKTRKAISLPSNQL